MQMIDMNDRKEREDFAQEAADYFAKHKEKTTYTSKDITPGDLFGVRFGMGEDCVVVFRLADDQVVENYQNIVSKENL